MSAAKRVRLIVAAIAVVAAGAVAGVVLRDPPGSVPADGAVPAAAGGSDRAGRPSSARGGRAGGAGAAAEARPHRRSSRSRSRHPKDPVVQFNYGTALFCAGYVADAEQAYRQAKKAGYDTYYEMRGGRDPAPAVLPAEDGLYPIFQYRSTPTHCSSRARCCNAAGTSTRRSGSRRGRPRSSRRTTRRRSRPRSAASTGRSLGVVLEARPAREALSAEPVGAVPPRSAARVDRATRPGDQGVPACTSSEFAEYTLERKRVPFCTVSSGVGPSTSTKMSRAAYGVRPVVMRPFRIRSGNARSPRGMSGQEQDRG